MPDKSDETEQDDPTPDISSDWAQIKRLISQFENDPSIRNYLALRKRGRMDTEIYRFGGFDPFLYLQDDLHSTQIDPYLILGALDGDDLVVDKLCLRILEKMVEREDLIATGRSHVQSRGEAISNALIDHLIVIMLEAINREGLAPTSSLVVLIRERLGGANPDYYKSYEKNHRRKQAIHAGYMMKREGSVPSIRAVAGVLGVQPSTVSRWFPDGDFLEQVNHWELAFVRLSKNNP